MWLRQSTASQEISLGQFLDSTDGNTEENGLTIANTDIKLRKGGTTTLTNKSSGGATNISNGVYHATLDATDTNTLGQLEIYVHVAGALATKSIYMVLPAASYDSLVTNGLNNLGGTAQTADHTAAIANIPTVSEFNARTILSASYSTAANLATVGSNVDSILIDTNDLQTNQGNWLTATGFNTVVPPSVAQFNARTLLSANYFVVGDYTAPDNAGITSNGNAIAALKDISAADVWSSVTRTLTSGANIVLAKGVGLTGLNDIAATAIVTGGAITTSAGNANVNVVKINGTNVIGAGTAGNLWRA